MQIKAIRRIVFVEKCDECTGPEHIEVALFVWQGCDEMRLVKCGTCYTLGFFFYTERDMEFLS